MAVSALAHRGPRPVADAPALDPVELARLWLVALVAAAPLERATRLPGPAFATEAPRLCAAVAAALAGDAALEDLEPGGALAPLAASATDLAGAVGASESVAAVEALRAVVWSSATEALHHPPPAQVAELADRLAAVIATVTGAGLEHVFAGGGQPGDRGPLAAVLRSTGPGAAGAPEVEDEPSASRRAEPSAGAVVDARSPGRSSAGSVDEARAPDRVPVASPVEEARAPDPVPAAGPVDEALAGMTARVEDASDFTARLAPWTAAIERRLERFAEDGRPFAVLCLEVTDLDRLIAADRDRDVAEALEAAELAICSQLRPADALLRERAGRYWLVSPDTDAQGGRSLAHLLAAAVASVPGHRGAPLEVAVGIATCPQDADDAPGLEGRAEEALFASRAAGLRVVGAPRP